VTAYWYSVATHRNVEAANSVCVCATRTRKEALIAAEEVGEKWRRLGWQVSLGRRAVESTGDVWWEVWAHSTPELELKPVATIYRVQTIE
jgi:hypothetical protein